MSSNVSDKPKKVGADWELIEKHFRVGQLSLREIAKAADNAVTEGAIRKRAARDGWTRDLKKKIEAAADELVRTAAVRSPSTQLSVSTEREVIDANAQIQYKVRMQARQDVTRTEDLFRKLLGELEAMTDNQDLFENLFDLLNDPTTEANASGETDKNPAAAVKQSDRERDRIYKLRQAFQRVMDSAGRIDSAKKLTEMLERLIKMKYGVFGITDEQGEGKVPVENLLASLGKLNQ